MVDYRVKRAQHIEDYLVEFLFADGSKRKIDLEPFLHGGIFDELRPLDAFRSFKVKYGTIVWPNGADIAPETLYYDLGPASATAQVPRKQATDYGNG